MRLNTFLITLVCAFIFNLDVVNAQTFPENLSIHSLSSIRYPAVSRTGNFTLSWPSEFIRRPGYTLDENDTQLQELMASGKWVEVPLEGYFSLSYTATGKSPGIYKYRLYRSFQYINEVECNAAEHGCTTDAYVEDYNYTEASVEVIVIGDAQ